MRGNINLFHSKYFDLSKQEKAQVQCRIIDSALCDGPLQHPSLRVMKWLSVHRYNGSRTSKGPWTPNGRTVYCKVEPACLDKLPSIPHVQTWPRVHKEVWSALSGPRAPGCRGLCRCCLHACLLTHSTVSSSTEEETVVGKHSVIFNFLISMYHFIST